MDNHSGIKNIRQNLLFEGNKKQLNTKLDEKLIKGLSPTKFNEIFGYFKELYPSKNKKEITDLVKNFLTVFDIGNDEEYNNLPAKDLANMLTSL